MPQPNSQIVHQLILLLAYCTQYHLQITFQRVKPIKTMKTGITIALSSLASSELLQPIRTPVLFEVLVWYFHVNLKLVLACNLSKEHKTNSCFLLVSSEMIQPINLLALFMHLTCNWLQNVSKTCFRVKLSCSEGIKSFVIVRGASVFFG